MVDIGTDHAQLPLALVRSGAVPSAIAMDVVAGPLAIARSATAGLRDQIEVRSSDGFDALKPDEVATACICGMGGRTMVGILQRGHAVWSRIERVILQPQGMADEVRAFMLKAGWQCSHGEIVADRGKLFTVEVWEPGAGTMEWSAEDLRWGKCIREGADPLYRQWLDRELADIDLALDRMGSSGASDHAKAHRARAERVAIQEERDRLG